MLYDDVRGCLIDNSFLKVIAYADDINVVIRNNHEFDKTLELINYFSIFAKIRLNVGKSQYMRLNNCLSGPHVLKEVSSLRILGIDLSENFKTIIENNYSRIILNIKFLISIHHKRKLNIYQKSWILNQIILSKLWYIAQVFPPNNSNIAEIRTICRNFIFKGVGLYKVKFDQLYLDVDQGGLSLVDVESKCKALFVKNILFPSQDGIKDSFMLSQQTNNTLSRNSREWLSLAEEISNDTDLNTSKKIYRLLISKQNIKIKIATEFPELPWQNYWQNIQSNFISSEEKHSLFIMLNDLIPTKAKLFRHKVRDTNTNLCEYCNKLDTSKHRIKLCSSSRLVWNSVKTTIIRKLGLDIVDPEELLGKTFKNEKEKLGLWLVVEAIAYNLKNFGNGTVADFECKVREKRWNNKKFYDRVFGKWICYI